MADAPAAAPPEPKPGEVQVDLGALGSDNIADVGDALAGLFGDDEPEIQSEAREGEPADVEEGEIPPIDEHEADHSDQPATAAIEPPASWTADEKKEFAELPPTLQQTVLRRESERERLTLTQSQKAAEEAKRLDAERQAVVNDRAQQVTLLQSVLYQLTPELQQFQAIDWDTLAREKPAEWASKRQSYESLMNRWGLAQQQIAGIQQTQQADAEKRHKDFIAEQQQQLVVKVPELADPIKLKALRDDVIAHLPEITPHELDSLGDHRYLLIVRDAMLYRKAVQARAQAQAKRAAPTPPARQPLRPTARRGTAGEEAQDRQLGALHETLRKSGKTQDAASLLAASGIFGKA